MKRVLLQVGVWLCCLLMLLLVGCAAGRGEVEPITDGFTCRAIIEYRELSLDTKLICLDSGKLYLTFNAPSSLSGITLAWDGQAMTMELGGISIDIAENKVPESALIKGLMHVLTADADSGTLSKEGYVLTGETEGMAYTLVCDPTTGLPRSLSVPDNELYATFTETTLLPDSNKSK